MGTSLRLSAAVSLAGRPPRLLCAPCLDLARILLTVGRLTLSCASIWRDERLISTRERMLLQVSSEMGFMARRSGEERERKLVVSAGGAMHLFISLVKSECLWRGLQMPIGRGGCESQNCLNDTLHFESALFHQYSLVSNKTTMHW